MIRMSNIKKKKKKGALRWGEDIGHWLMLSDVKKVDIGHSNIIAKQPLRICMPQYECPKTGTLDISSKVEYPKIGHWTFENNT